MTQSHGLVPGVTGAEQRSQLLGLALPEGGQRLAAPGVLPNAEENRRPHRIRHLWLHRRDHVTGLAPPLEKFGPADLLGEPGRGCARAAR